MVIAFFFLHFIFKIIFCGFRKNSHRKVNLDCLEWWWNIVYVSGIISATAKIGRLSVEKLRGLWPASDERETALWKLFFFLWKLMLNIGKQNSQQCSLRIIWRLNSTAKMTPLGWKLHVFRSGLVWVSQLRKLPGQVQSDFGGRLDSGSGIKMYQLVMSEQFSK